MSKWYEISVATTSEAADLIADVFFSEGCQGVSIKDKRDVAELYGSGIIWDYIDERITDGYDDAVYVKAVIGEDGYADTLADIRNSLDSLKSLSPFNVGGLELVVSPLDDTDWRSEWKKYFKPIVTESVTVVPKWIDYKGAPGEKLLYINPGMAFGTGEHETTKMCLDLLGEEDVDGKTVIDVGTGSGILAIAAVLCGAKSAYACDIDTAAVTTAKENAGLNGTGRKVTIECADLLEKTDKKGELVFANITADILIMLSRRIGEHLESGGRIILSGIIHERLPEVKKAYISRGFTILKRKSQGEWNALLLSGK